MLNIIQTENMPNLDYIEEARRFLNNTIAFSYGKVTKDYSNFDPMVIDMMKRDPQFLDNMVVEMQSMIITLLKDDENFSDVNQLKYELGLLIELYSILPNGQQTHEEEDTMFALHDKFLCLLLANKEFVQFLHDMTQHI